jgi:OOP family OmpA-OmpF porin
MRPRALIAALALLAPLSVPALALAQESPPSLDLRGFRASIDPAAGLYQEPADSPGTAEWSVGFWTSYAYRPITLRDARTDSVVFNVIKHQVTSDLTAGVGIGHRLLLGLDLPVLLYQTGDTPTATSQRVLGDAPLPNQALGDLGINGKLTLIRPTGGEHGGFALAFHERFTVPTGDTGSYLGEGAVTSESRLLAEYRLVALGAHLALGVKIRGENENFACGAVPLAADCNTRFGHSLPFGLGFDLRPQAFGIDPKGKLTFYVDAYGQLPISPIAPFQSTGASSMRLGLGARYVVARDVSVLAGLETALIAGVGDAPARALASIAWAPRSHDLDKDTVDDDVDQCKELPEDKDGFQDEDGCPDLDNDDDGVPDAADKCGAVKEDEDGFDDGDGCPDPDNDGDKILDGDDMCPNEAGPPSADKSKNGCPVHDRDGDGLEDGRDKCPDKPEDADNFQDDDGCPESDNDEDGIVDGEDACPIVKGIDASDPKLRGCPDPDPDKDSFVADEDKCRDQAETWNGVDDGDGCPDEAPKGKAKPQVSVKESKAKGTELVVEQALSFVAAGEIDAGALLTLRAVSSELLAHPAWSLVVGVRPSPKSDAAEAEAKARAIVAAIRRFTRRESAAAVAGWDTVKGAPRAAERGIGFLLQTGEEKVAAPEKAPPPAPKAAPPKAPLPPPVKAAPKAPAPAKAPVPAKAPPPKPKKP